MIAMLEIYRRARSLGLSLETDGQHLLVTPANRVPPDFVEELKAHKPELISWLKSVPCPGWQTLPPDDLSLNPIEPSPTPEERGQILDYLVRQGCDRPGPLTAWLVRRECSYYDGPGHTWDCASFSYAAARDAACWQLNRTESEVLNFLSLENNQNYL